MIITKHFLISELNRFKKENSRVPIAAEMNKRSGYPSYATYTRHFGSWNEALETVGFKINAIRECKIGNKICCECKNSLTHEQTWFRKDLSKNQVMCTSCYNKLKTNYRNGNLNKSSNVAKATISQRVVANVLDLKMKDDCNCSIGFNHPYDLYDKRKYGMINVKDSKLSYNNDSFRWKFGLTQKEVPDTYIMLGYDKNRKNILRIWIIKCSDFLVNEKNSLSITNTPFGLIKATHLKVNSKQYNDMLHIMSQKRKETNGENCFLSNSDLK